MRHLDFIAFGVPRSGTTALVKALNMHPDIMCGVERFHYLTDPQTIYFPDSFRNPKFRTPQSKLLRTIEILEEKGDGVAFAGDKSPRYYCNLQKWMALSSPPKTVAIYRSPYFFLDSWRRRAESVEDRWPPEQVGLFGLWEMFALLRNTLKHADNTLFIPYDACFFDNPDTIKRVVEHIGGDPERYDHERFVNQLFAQSKRSREQPVLPIDEVRLLEAANVRKIDSVLLRDDVFIVGDVRQEMERYLASVPASLSGLGDQWLSERQSPSMSKYLVYWVSNFAELETLPNAEAVPKTFREYAAISRSMRSTFGRYAREIFGSGYHAIRGLRRQQLPKA